MSSTANQSIFSVDVEDWFHILALPDAPDLNQWAAYPSRVSDNFRKLLDVFDQHRVQVTCFFLGWVAERFPELAREAHARGHEVASHGYSHTLVYEMTPAAFREDIARAKKILEDAVGAEVRGYRCPGFSVTKDTPWFFDVVKDAGYAYDSSVFPAPRQHGGLTSDQYAPYVKQTKHGPLVEFPVTVAEVMGKPMCFFGGGYLRLFPFPVVKVMSERVLAEGRPVVFYVHPREIDPGHPRMKMSAARRFKSYVGLRGTEQKIHRILREFRVTTFRDYLANELAGAGAPAQEVRFQAS
ncbi:MAG TPA: XrtA system polysaccharide deacetylase [Polyangiaceae bacterium]|jgi:polysaccharide deacetylase family protein (PEP-CTERM system associated)